VTNLIRIQSDDGWMTVIRQGRFDAPAEVGSTPAELLGNKHGRQLVEEMQRKMVDGLAAKGQFLVEGGLRAARQGTDTFQLMGPYPHKEFSTNDTPDRVPGAVDAHADPARFADWELEDKERRARDLSDDAGDQTGKRDWVIRAVFKKRTPLTFHRHVPEMHEFRAARLRATGAR
jgi:hypothetical protein